MSDPRDEPLISEAVWEAATDPLLPPGVIVLIDADGNRHPMPLIEFGDIG